MQTFKLCKPLHNPVSQNNQALSAEQVCPVEIIKWDRVTPVAIKDCQRVGRGGMTGYAWNEEL